MNQTFYDIHKPYVAGFVTNKNASVIYLLVMGLFEKIYIVVKK